jgi:hypothetical protein
VILSWPAACLNCVRREDICQRRPSGEVVEVLSFLAVLWSVHWYEVPVLVEIVLCDLAVELL